MLVGIGIAAFGLAVRFLPVMEHVEEPELPRPPPSVARRHAGRRSREELDDAAPDRHLRREAPPALEAPRRSHGPRARVSGRRPSSGLADQLSLERQRAQIEGLVGALRRPAGRDDRAGRRTTVMLRNDADGVRRVVANIGAQEGVDPHPRVQQGGPRPRLVRSPPRRARSSDQALRRVHRLPRGRAAQGRPRAEGPDPDAPRPRTAGASSASSRPIYNEPKLHRPATCTRPSQRGAGHPRRAPVDGPGRRRRSATSERQMQLRPPRHRGARSGRAVASCMLWALVLRPVRRLRSAMERAGEGDLQARVPVRSQDEMGELARSWNEMTGDLKRAREDLEGLNRTLEERRRGEDPAARAHAPPDGGGREDGLARQAGRRRGPRDQQPARRHPDLRPPPAAAVRVRHGRPPDARAGGRDRPHPADGGRRGRPLRRHRAQPARLQPRRPARVCAEEDLAPVVERLPDAASSTRPRCWG